MEGREQTEGRRHPAGPPGRARGGSSPPGAGGRGLTQSRCPQQRSVSSRVSAAAQRPRDFRLVFTEKSLSASRPPGGEGFRGQFPGCFRSCAAVPGVVWEALAGSAPAPPPGQARIYRPLFTDFFWKALALSEELLASAKIPKYK